MQLLAIAFLLAQPPADAIRLPREVLGKPKARIEVQAETMGKFVRWRMQDGGPLLIDDLPDLRAQKKTLVYGCDPGRYKLECWTAIGEEPSLIYSTEVVITGDLPNPPPPPIPPPSPPPPPAPPPDPLVKKLQAAFESDAGLAVVKRGQVANLIGLCEAMVVHAKNEKIRTTADLLSDYRATAKDLVLPNQLTTFRQLLAAEVAATFGDVSVPLDDATRSKAVALFDRLAKAMGGVK